MMGPVKTILPNPSNPMDDDTKKPMTEVQAVQLRELTQELDEPFDSQLTQRQASERIAALEKRKDG